MTWLLHFAAAPIRSDCAVDELACHGRADYEFAGQREPRRALGGEGLGLPRASCPQGPQGSPALKGRPAGPIA